MSLSKFKDIYLYTSIHINFTYNVGTIKLTKTGTGSYSDLNNSSIAKIAAYITPQKRTHYDIHIYMYIV